MADTGAACIPLRNTFCISGAAEPILAALFLFIYILMDITAVETVSIITIIIVAVAIVAQPV